MEKYLKYDLDHINQIGSLYQALKMKKREERSSKSLKQSNLAREVIQQMDLNDIIPEHVQSQTVRTCHQIFMGTKKMKKEDHERKAPGRKAIVHSTQISMLVAEIEKRIVNNELPKEKLYETLTVELLRELLKKVDPEYELKISQGRYSSYYLKFNLRNAIMKHLGWDEQTVDPVVKNYGSHSSHQGCCNGKHAC